jgi:hypothetical protein
LPKNVTNLSHSTAKQADFAWGGQNLALDEMRETGGFKFEWMWSKGGFLLIKGKGGYFQT